MSDKLRLTGKNDIKIFILVLLEGVGYPLEYDDISQIVISDDFVGYFEFADCFAELLSAGHIIESKEEESVNYTLSPTGYAVASQLQDKVLLPIREQAFRSALRILSFTKRGAEISCEISERDGSYLVECRITEKNSILMSASVLSDSRERAEKMKANFLIRPEVVFRGLSALLACEVDYLFE